MLAHRAEQQIFAADVYIRCYGVTMKSSPPLDNTSGDWWGYTRCSRTVITSADAEHVAVSCGTERHLSVSVHVVCVCFGWCSSFACHVSAEHFASRETSKWENEKQRIHLFLLWHSYFDSHSKIICICCQINLRMIWIVIPLRAGSLYFMKCWIMLLRGRLKEWKRQV